MVELTHATVTHDFAAPAADVHAAWLSPHAAADWMARTLEALGLNDGVGEVSLDPRIGGRFRFSHLNEGLETTYWGRYQALESPSLMEFTWFMTPEQEAQNASMVRVELTPTGAGCTAKLTHWFSVEQATEIARAERGWKSLMTSLDDHLAAW